MKRSMLFLMLLGSFLAEEAVLYANPIFISSAVHAARRRRKRAGSSYNHRHHYNRSAYDNSCAPESVEGNLKATDRILGELIVKKSFDQYPEFVKQIQTIINFDDLNKKIDAYGKVVGVNPYDNDDMVRFVNARKEDYANYAHHIITQHKLSLDLANEAIEAVVKGLRGGL